MVQRTAFRKQPVVVAGQGTVRFHDFLEEPPAGELALRSCGQLVVRVLGPRDARNDPAVQGDLGLRQAALGRVVDQAQAETPRGCLHARIAAENAVAARLGRSRQVVAALQAAAEPVLCLQYRDDGALLGQQQGGVKTGKPGADHDDVGLRGGAHGIGPAERGRHRGHAQALERVPPADASRHE